jgi:protein SCO1/2
MVLTPSGKISRYFFGIDYSAKDLGIGLVDASSETIAAPAPAKTILYCFQYDATTGKYSLIVTRALRVAAVATMLALGSFIFIMIRRDRAKLNALRPQT